ncbi:hypothetical protein ABW636_15755 [Aquimarina sp. 2201CG1-2-11]|uniref:hypothetical protein n=1 Tax=Aquimarina discodermiae TaxID=3231043 RepID=UPI0034623E70
MKFDKILNYLFGYQKSSFEITNEEFEILNRSKPNNKPLNRKDIRNTEQFIESTTVQDWFDEIYEEVFSKTGGDIVQLWLLKFSKLDSYIELKKEPIPIKRALFYLLTNTISETYVRTNSYFQDDQSRFIMECKKELISLLIKTNLELTEKDYKYFIKFWKHHALYFYPIGVFMTRLKKKVKKDGISENLQKFLRSTLKWKCLQTTYYSGYYKRTREIIEEILAMA